MKYCIHCGQSLDDNSHFCSRCGQPSLNKNPHNENEVSSTIPMRDQNVCETANLEAQKIAEYEKISSILWIVIAVIQILMIYPFIAGIWNLVNSIINFKFIKTIQPGNQAIYQHYQKNLWNIIAFLAINLLLGGIIGAILTIFDFWIRDYALKRAWIFDEALFTDSKK